jgi:hypothetical protein
MNATEKKAAIAAATASVQSAAFNAGTSRNVLLNALFAACGAKPKLALFNAVSRAVVVGYMAAALARKGDNRPEATILAHCVDRLDNYQGAGGTAPLRSGMKGRRTDAEEAAYVSARNLTSRAFADAGVTVPTKSGKASGKGKAKGTTSKATKGNKAEASDKPAVRTFKNAEELCAYALIQAKAMQATLSQTIVATKNTGVPATVSEPIAAFLAAMITAADALGIATA